MFLGFAPARLLHRLSVADILNEETGAGYQRRFNARHSIDFRNYIRQPGSTTIPLTFNLRTCDPPNWRVTEASDAAKLIIDDSMENVLYQVDGQHRLGHLVDVDVPLAFMAYMGLRPEEEMEVFSTINGKAKGLSTSLLDYHEARLASDLEREKPQLFIALRLHEDRNSPWYQQLDLGGSATSGLQRRASLRTMQKAVRRFLKQTEILQSKPPDYAYRVIRDFWNAITDVLDDEWARPRKHFLTKGIGVYSLTTIAGELYLEGAVQSRGANIGREFFAAKLIEFACDFDWSNAGPLKGLGGESGAAEAAQMLRELRKTKTMRVVTSAE